MMEQPNEIVDLQIISLFQPTWIIEIFTNFPSYSNILFEETDSPWSYTGGD